jgi:hypothetical protein
MEYNIYPTFTIHPEGRLIPYVRLPPGHQERLPIFRRRGGEQKIEEYAKEVNEIVKGEIGLRWSDEEGLTDIIMGSGGKCLHLDAEEREFIESNLDGWFAFYAAAIAQEYVAELLKSSPSQRLTKAQLRTEHLK